MMMMMMMMIITRLFERSPCRRYTPCCTPSPPAGRSVGLTATIDDDVDDNNKPVREKPISGFYAKLHMLSMCKQVRLS
jgi:hypothetical protein